jgi:hypothetical protein
MPIRQETFKLVPTTLVNNTTPRRPMTSKAAKKAYQQATRTPRISKAEQRRIEAEEIARQKKEYEKEKAAAKAKAAREKKAKKEQEERGKRKKLGLPEPSRFVRPSQPTIKRFVKAGAGAKRTWQEMDDMAEENTDTEAKEVEDDKAVSQDSPPPKIAALQEQEEDDYGDFPSLSQADLPGLFATPNKGSKGIGSPDTSRQISSISLLDRVDSTEITREPRKLDFPDLVQHSDEAKIDAKLTVEKMLVAVEVTAPKAASTNQAAIPTTVSIATSGRLPEVVQPLPKLSPPSTYRSDYANVIPTIIRALPLAKSPKQSSKSMPPPPHSYEVSNVRKPLREVSANMPPPPLPSKSKVVPAKSRSRIQTNEVYDPKQRQDYSRALASIPPPSTLAFLEANFDDFFPSHSQQVRELLEEVDDMPSNTQIAREIHSDEYPITIKSSHPLLEPEVRQASNFDLEDADLLEDFGDLFSNTQIAREIDSHESPIAIQIPHLPPEAEVELEPALDYEDALLEDFGELFSNTQIAQELNLDEDCKATRLTEPTPETEPQTEDPGLHLWSPQDFEISSQDLREINTPSQVPPRKSPRLTSTHRDLGLAQTNHPACHQKLQSKPVPKPRFFEEKDEDLMAAALHESLLMANQKVDTPSPRRSPRIAQATKRKEMLSDDDYDFAGFEIDPELLAALDEAEERSMMASSGLSC